MGRRWKAIVGTLLLLAAAALPAALAREGWTDPPYDCSRCHVGAADLRAELKFELKHPEIATAEDVLAVRSLQRRFAERFGDAAFVHPPEGIACSACHEKGKLAFHRFAIDESDPAASCARCHGLAKLQKVKYEVKARTGFDAGDAQAIDLVAGRIADLPRFDEETDYPPSEEVKLGAEVRVLDRVGGAVASASLLPSETRAYAELATAHLVPGAASREVGAKLEGKSRSDDFDWSRCDAYFTELDSELLAALPRIKIQTKVEPRKRKKDYKLKDPAAEEALLLADILEPSALSELPDDEFKNEFKVRNDADPRLVDEAVEFLLWKASEYRRQVVKTKFEVKWKPADPSQFEHKVELAAADR